MSAKQDESAGSLTCHDLRKELLLFLIILPFFFFIGCSQKDDQVFSSLTNELFISETTSNTLNLHYTLSDPKSYGIEDYDITLGDISLQALESKPVDLENYLKRLHKLNTDKLSSENQLTYDILESYLSDKLSLSENLLYDELLSPSSGLQSQLPILFAEYKFDSEKDVEEYLCLLSQIDGYFNQAIAFEAEKSEAGYFMNDYIVDQVIDQCRQIGVYSDSHFLVATFNDKLDAVEELTLAQKTKYRVENVEILYEHVFPAYDSLTEGLEKLKGTCKNTCGLFYLPEGKAYYEDLVAYTTGSDKSIKELKKLLTEQFYEDYLSLTELIRNNSTLTGSTSQAGANNNPEQMIEDLKEKMKKDFPEAPDVNYEVKYVHDSLEEYLSPAFYLTPTIDNMKDNTIYINNVDGYDSLQLYTTLAHEGYPGHLYQTTYTNQYSNNPVRNLVNYGGFTEGWALYVEMYAYGLYDGLEPALCEITRLDQSLQLCLYCLVDIGVHYEGWTYDDTLTFLSKYISLSSSGVEQLYNLILERPANYLKYYVGYLEICQLRDKAMEQLKDDFNLKDFHQFLLEIGPAPFSVFDERLDIWISDIQSRNAQ